MIHFGRVRNWQKPIETERNWKNSEAGSISDLLFFKPNVFQSTKWISVWRNFSKEKLLWNFQIESLSMNQEGSRWKLKKTLFLGIKEKVARFSLSNQSSGLVQWWSWSADWSVHCQDPDSGFNVNKRTTETTVIREDRLGATKATSSVI